MTTTRKWGLGALGVLIVLVGGWFALRGIGSGPAAAPAAASAASHAEAPGPLSPTAAVSASPNSAEELAALQQMEKAAENAHLALYVNRQTAEIAVQQRTSGYIWFSNPVGKEDDPLASPLYKSELASQVKVSYYNDKGQLSAYNSYDDSVKKQQFAIDQTADGVKVVYTIGKAAAPSEGIPKAISRQRMEDRILSRIDEEETRKSLLYKFRYDEQKQVYTARDMQDYVAREVLNILERAGYTREDAAWDNEANGIAGAGAEAAETALFTIPVVYSLQDDQLAVTVPAGEIRAPASYPIDTIGVLPYFGAAGSDKQGYLLVPDGSGALIRLNNGKRGAEPYRLPVYGEDGTRVVKERRQENEVSRLPVFGMKAGDHAFVGIIERGDALASIAADVSGRFVSYNSIFSDFLITAKEDYTLTSGTRSSSVPVFQKKRYEGDLQIRYAFAEGAAADYVGMAALYRNYLVRKYGLQPLPAAEHSPFVLEVAGAFRKTKSLLGVPYRSTEPLTTFDQARELLDQLREQGVDRIALRYVGWFNGGIRHASPARIAPAGALGGSSGLRRLADYAKANGIDFFPDAAFLEAYKGAGSAAEFLNRGKAKIYAYDPVMHTQDKSRFSHYIVSAAKLLAIVDGFVRDYGKLGLSGLSLRDLGGEINSDYAPAHPVDRQSALETIEAALSKIDGAAGEVMVQTGNAYALPYAGWIVRAPTGSSRMNLTDEDVPFYQIALHGYFQLAGEPFNMGEDQNPRRAMLQALETGSNVYYEWFYRESSVVKDTDFNTLYALRYRDWFEEAVRLYREADPVLREVGHQPIVGHRKLADGVYLTEYANGLAVAVNYNPAPVTIGGVAIGPESFSLEVSRDAGKGGE